MEPFYNNLEQQSTEEFDDIMNYNNYSRVDDVSETLLDNVKSDTHDLNSFNIVKEYDIPADNTMIVDDSSDSSDLEDQESNSSSSSESSEQSDTSTSDIPNVASNNSNSISEETTKLSDNNDKPMDVDTINKKKNDSFRKPSTPKFRYYCFHCSEARDVSHLFKKNDCMKCGKLMVFQCLKCKKNYEKPASIKYHLQVCNDHEKRFECAQCNYRTSASVLLKKHKQRMHVDAKELQCSKCNQKFKFPRRLRAHERFCCGEKANFACALCSYKAHLKHHLKRHIRSHERYFQKTVDDLKNKNLEALDHLKQNYRDKLYSCESKIQAFFQRYCSTCNENFENSLIVNSTKCKSCNTKFLMRCIVCDSLHKSSWMIAHHLRQQCILKSNSQCPTCDFSTVYPSNLKKHIERKHGKINPEKLYKCSKCTSSFRFKSGLKKHVKYGCDFDESYLLCDHCPFRTKIKTDLVIHMKTHMQI